MHQRFDSSRVFGKRSDLRETLGGALPTGAAVGLGAFVVNYAVMYVFLFLDGADFWQLATWRVVGMVFFSAHNVVAEASTTPGPIAINLITGERMAFLTGITTTVPGIVYKLGPIIVLVAAGLAGARRTGARDAVTGAITGATITVGYLALSIIGVLIVSITLLAVTYSPSTLVGIVVVGIVYPAVCGAIGGAIGGATR